MLRSLHVCEITLLGGFSLFKLTQNKKTVGIQSSQICTCGCQIRTRELSCKRCPVNLLIRKTHDFIVLFYGKLYICDFVSILMSFFGFCVSTVNITYTVVIRHCYCFKTHLKCKLKTVGLSNGVFILHPNRPHFTSGEESHCAKSLFVSTLQLYKIRL